MTHAADDASKQTAANLGKNNVKTAPIEVDNIASESEQQHSTMKRDARTFSSPIVAEGLNTQIYTGSISENSISDNSGDDHNDHYEPHDEKLVTVVKQVTFSDFELVFSLLSFNRTK